MPSRTFIITGAASGIGLACVRVLLKDPGQPNIVAVDIQEQKLRSELPGDEPRLCLMAGDLSHHEVCERVVSTALGRFGELDALIHWAAMHSSKRWDELGSDECNRVMAVNVTGSFLMAQAAARYMQTRGRGAIVLCASAAVLYGITGGDGQGGPAYVASKGAIVALTRSFARALAPHGIRVNAISPGLTETPLIAGYTDQKRSKMLERFPLGRFAEPEEIAHAAVFLTSDKASFMTGEIMHVNGGSNFGS